jgi:putative phosphoribosyl transferase
VERATLNISPSSVVVWRHADTDEVVCLAAPPQFDAVGLWYRNFSQTSDEEVIALLARGRWP